MNLARGLLKMGAVLITGALILTGCGNSSSASDKNTPAIQSTTLPTPVGSTSTAVQPSVAVSAEKASIQKIDPKTPQGQAELDKGLDQKLQTLDSALDKLDKSMASLK